VIVIDSSGWLEFFTDGPQAEAFASPLRRPSEVAAPTIAIYEVYKWIKRQRSEEDALYAVAAMRKTSVIELTDELALAAADVSLAHGLAMADAIMLATARAVGADLLTLDSEFQGLEGATVLRKKP
jgi:toxin FitB